jgi:plastocyanin
MVRSYTRWMIFGCSFLLMGISVQQLHGEGVEVSGKILVRGATQPAGKKHKDSQDSLGAANAVVWLSPLKPGTVSPVMPARQALYRLVQKDKMFTPHLLVVPTGSQVEFPNQDPFFHNVFSLFNGKRFDLGLYESGTSRSVRFDREGVSYIFCNIHPEMGAIVLVLSTPYYGISDENGVVVLHNVPPGSYRLNVWSENGQLANPSVSQRIVQVSTDAIHLGDITLQAAADPLANHKNKFGEDYEPSQGPKY